MATQNDVMAIDPVLLDSDDDSELPELARASIMMPSEPMADGAVPIRGYDFSEGLDYHKLIQSFLTTGFQASNFGKAIVEINKMLDEKMKPLPKEELAKPNKNPWCSRTRSACTIFLGCTSNMISSGVRETLRFLVKHDLIDCLVTSAGGIEEDLVKCFGATYSGDFRLSGKLLYSLGHNRIGNMILPNTNYVKCMEWMQPIFDRMYKEQEEQRINWTPSKIIWRLGKEINNEESVLYWAYKNNIPVFSPGLTDGFMGDMLYMHSYSRRGLRIDVVEDVRRMNNLAIHAYKTGMIILGGGIAKHHICNANCMRNGADYALYVNTASEYDGSDSGAAPDEAVSWGKIKENAVPVKVFGDATILFPLLVAETFFPHSRSNGIKKQ